MTPRFLSLAILAFAGIAAAPQALALGFGRMPDALPFGQALDLSIPLRLDAGESIAPGCVQAEVHVGEQRLPPGALQAMVEQRGDDARVRLRSAAVVQEPVVAVNLAVGCSGTVSRQFMLFADPPESRAAVVPRVATPPMPLPAPAEQALQQERSPAPRGTAVRKPPARTAGAQVPRTPAAPAPRRAARKEVPPRTVASAAAPATPRLKLEEPEALLRAATLTVAAQDAAAAVVAQAASAAQAAASAADQRLAAMDKQLQRMHEEAGASRAALDQLRGRLAQADEQGRWQTLLAAAVLLLGGLVAWLAWRLRALQRERQAGWWQAAQQAAAEVPAPQAEAAPAQADTAPPRAAGAWPQALSDSALLALDEVPPPQPQRTAVLPVQPGTEDPLARPVSVDELIDLEQQAEFFLVLGEEDSAVDLLMAHLRSSGGASPLPYLKLLEIYRGRGDREAYERLRTRFGQRFNAVAPDWGSNPGQGHDLLGYPAALARLQARWPRPLDAMAELENLLFRKRSGELFELPAYRDVLSLYSVARDLHRQSEDAGADVDVLLPLDDEVQRRAGPPSIFDTTVPPAMEQAPEDRPTAPVDLDLSELTAPRDSRPGALAPLRVTLGPT